MKQKQVKVETKEIRFGPQTDEHDYQFKAQARYGVPQPGQQGSCIRFLPWSLYSLQGAGWGSSSPFRQWFGRVRKGGADAKGEGKKMFLYMSPKKAGTAKKSQQKMDREKREAEAKAAADAERAANAEKNSLLANAKGGDTLKKLAEGTED